MIADTGCHTCGEKLDNQCHLRHHLLAAIHESAGSIT